MLLSETYLNTSPGRGLGLFARNKILVGEKFWIRSEVFDRVITEYTLTSLPPLAVLYIKQHGFQEKNGNWYLCGDNARFTNHSKNANTHHKFSSSGILESCIASRDIQADEEILCDYTEICLTCEGGVPFLDINDKFPG